MNSKNIQDFFALFSYVSMKEDLQERHQTAMSSAIESINCLYNNSVSDIKTNLWVMPAADRELYLAQTIRGIAVATRSLTKHADLILDFQSGGLNPDNWTVFEHYIIVCSTYKRSFANSLDLICADFKVDLFEIQNEIGISLLKNRNLPELYHAGHNNLFDTKIVDGLEYISLKSKEEGTSKVNTPSIQTNNFNGQPLDEVTLHFERLCKMESKTKGNNRPILTKDQLTSFINSAFIQNTPSNPKIEINKGSKDEAQIIAVFHAYYADTASKRLYYSSINKNTRSDYVRLLTDHLTGFDYEKTLAKFRS